MTKLPNTRFSAHSSYNEEPLINHDTNVPVDGDNSKAWISACVGGEAVTVV